VTTASGATPPRIVIAAGGTAGHVVPAIAVADALRAEGAEVSFVGGERAEAELVPAAGYPLDPIVVEGISRSNPLKAARAVLKAARALGTARAILRERRPDAVLGGGGYVAGPVGLAAALARIPLVLAEADSHLGLTNRALASRATRVCLAFPLEVREPPRYVVTGRPVPPEVAESRAEARAALGLPAEGVVVLVFGGLTLALQNEVFIKLKPTIVNAMFGMVLLGGLYFRKPLLAIVLDSMFELTEEGWRKLTFRWALFFFALAALNEIVWRTQTTDFWVSFKVFGIMPLTIVFALAQTPLLLRHDLSKKDDAAGSEV
jgi:intracellular septation protein A